MRIANSNLLVCVVLTALLPAVPAFAQDDGALLREGLFARDRNVSVLQRPRPEYAPIAMRLGSFYVLPSITASVEGNDNIYATSASKVSDAIFRVNPAVEAKSNWNRHALSLFANLNSSFYSSKNSENTTDYLVGFDGRLDVSHDFGFAGGASYERDTEPRTSSASPQNLKEPIQYDVARAYGESTYATNRLRLTGRVSVDDFTYDNGTSTVGGQIYEKDRDHTQWTEAARAEYALVPNTSVFLLGTVNQREYRNPGLLSTNVLEPKRDSTGVTLSVGSNFDLTHTLRGEVAVGYLDQNYDAAAYSEIKGVSFSGKVQWFPTQLTTVTLSGARTPEDAGILGVGGYISTNFSATVDHELLRNLLLNAGVSYGKDDYKNYDRQDERTSEFVGARYLMNRAVTVNLGYTHYNQDSSGVFHGASFDVNRVYASLTYAF
jgi:hypothetical protein